MNKFLIIAAMLLVSLTSYSQIHDDSSDHEEEISRYKKINKDLLKQMKKTYQAKLTVSISSTNAFYIVMKKKEGKKERYLFANEAGTLLYPDAIDYYTVIDDNICLGVLGADSHAIWGVVNMKGQVIFPIQYSKVQYNKPQEAGTFIYSSLTYWHPASQASWVVTDKSVNVLHQTFYQANGKTVIAEYDGNLVSAKSYFWSLESMDKSAMNQKGLLTLDGHVIFPQEYYGFYFEKENGMVNSIKQGDDHVKLLGAKMLDDKKAAVEVPALFNDVQWNNEKNCFEYKMHRDDDFKEYQPTETYQLSYKDKGERLYDAGKYEDVITYYEGEGYGVAIGDYYMGLSAKKIADAESDKMNNCISTLESPNLYYFPVKYPDEYEFNTGTMTTMYLSARSYFEKYMNNTTIAADDPTMIKARKLRGVVVTASNNVTKKIEEYGQALTSATTKNVQREANIAVQNAQRQAAANSLATGLTDLIFGGSSKKK